MNVSRKLFNKLQEIHCDKDFVIGVMSNAKNVEDRQAILDFIENESTFSVEDIILLSLHLHNERLK